MSTQEGGKGGLIAGVFAALGFGGLRAADDCAVVGARSMSAVDDLAVGGSRAAGEIDDAARAGSGAPVRGAPVRGAPVSRGARPLLGGADEGLHVEQLGEVVGDVALEFVSYPFESDIVAPDTFVELVERPVFVDLARDPRAWAHLVSTGEGADQAPWIVVGRARGQSLLFDDESVPVTELGAKCWSLGTTCIFVACETDCASVTERAFATVRPRKGMQVESYVTQFLTNRFATVPEPAFVAIAGAERERTVMLIRPPIHAP